MPKVNRKEKEEKVNLVEKEANAWVQVQS
jgi:hypothetical protein